jgi:hypothetical protein
VAVVALVGDEERAWVRGIALDVLPRGAPLHGAAPVVPARERGPLDGLLPVLAPAVLVAGDVRAGRAGGRRHAHRPRRAAARVLAPLPQAVACRGVGCCGGGRAGLLALRQRRLARGHDDALPLRHAALAACRHGRQERSRRRRLREVQRQALLLALNSRRSRRRGTRRGRGRRVRDSHRRTAEAGVARAVQQVDDAAEPVHGLVRDLAKRRRVAGAARRQRRRQELQAAEARGGGLLERKLLAEGGAAHQVHGHGWVPLDRRRRRRMPGWAAPDWFFLPCELGCEMGEERTDSDLG